MCLIWHTSLSTLLCRRLCTHAYFFKSLTDSSCPYKTINWVVFCFQSVGFFCVVKQTFSHVISITKSRAAGWTVCIDPLFSSLSALNTTFSHTHSVWTQRLSLCMEIHETKRRVLTRLNGSKRVFPICCFDILMFTGNIKVWRASDIREKARNIRGGGRETCQVDVSPLGWGRCMCCNPESCERGLKRSAAWLGLLYLLSWPKLQAAAWLTLRHTDTHVQQGHWESV